MILRLCSVPRPRVTIKVHSARAWRRATSLWRPSTDVFAKLQSTQHISGALPGQSPAAWPGGALLSPFVFFRVRIAIHRFAHCQRIVRRWKRFSMPSITQYEQDYTYRIVLSHIKMVPIQPAEKHHHNSQRCPQLLAPVAFPEDSGRRGAQP